MGRATGRVLAYVWPPVTAFPTVELTIYPYECDAFGHLNQAALLGVLERARWEALARGPGMDLFDRNGVWPAARKAVIEYKAGVYPRDVLRVETAVAHRGTTSMTLRHVARRVSDGAVVAEAEMVFVCIDRLGRPAPIPEEIARFLGPRTSGSHQPIRVRAGDAELAVEVRGDGLPVLLVHGFPFDRTMWRHQLAALSRWRRIAPDLLGVGDGLRIPSVVACGLSMGGYVVFELLRRYPERVRAVILADTKPGADSAEARRGRDELAALAERDGHDAVIDRLLPRLLAPATRTTQPEVVAQVRDMARRWSVPGLVGALRASRDRPDSSDVLGRIRVPALVLVGGDDEVSPPAVVEAMAKRIPDAQFHVIPAAGHLAPLEQPLATSRLVADFLGTLA